MIEIRSAYFHNEEVLEINRIVDQGIDETPQYTDVTKAKEKGHLSFDDIIKSIRDNLCLVAVDDGLIVGVCFGSDEDGPIWLNWIVVEARYQGQGIGKKLMRRFLILAARRGHKVWCSVLMDNAPSNALMQRFGFTPVAELFKHWHGLDFNLWQKTLERVR